MKGRFIALPFVALAAHAYAAQKHAVRGILLEVHPSAHTIVLSCDAIPHVMDAMTMPFTVRSPENLDELKPGMTVSFTLTEDADHAYADNLHVVRISNHESEPTEAARLTFLHRTLDRTASAKIVQVGQPVPDFTLTDQAQHTTSLSQFRGKVVALTFAYSRCPNPSYCFRLSNNLAILERRFRARAGRDLILITIVIDPAQDRGAALARYAETWKADPAAWRFLTGPLPDVRAAAELFGMGFWRDEGFLTHSFHTVVIDRDGNLAANLEGNEFTAAQLGDLVETVLRRPAHTRANPKD